MAKESLVIRKQKDQQQIFATGRRKTASARVRILTPGSGRISVNRIVYTDYFPRETHRIVLKQALKLTEMSKKIDIAVNVKGGGLSSQSEAARHGLSRAIMKLDENKKTALKKAGFLTRDAREKERKKYGRKKARKKFQFSKR